MQAKLLRRVDSSPKRARLPRSPTPQSGACAQPRTRSSKRESSRKPAGRRPSRRGRRPRRLNLLFEIACESRLRLQKPPPARKRPPRRLGASRQSLARLRARRRSRRKRYGVRPRQDRTPLRICPWCRNGRLLRFGAPRRGLRRQRRRVQRPRLPRRESKGRRWRPWSALRDDVEQYVGKQRPDERG